MVAVRYRSTGYILLFVPKITTQNYQLSDWTGKNRYGGKRTVATGKVEPRKILIKPQMSGIISAVYKQAGDNVTAGDVIAKIKVIPDMVNLSSAESRVSRAKISFDQSKINFDRDKELYEKKWFRKKNLKNPTSLQQRYGGTESGSE